MEIVKDLENPKEEYDTFSIRIPKVLKEAAVYSAKKEDRTTNRHITRMIKFYLKKHPDTCPNSANFMFDF